MGRLFRFGPPEPRRDLLLRPRLLSILLGRWDHRVTLLVGGPGFGKTTLLVQAIAENQLAPRGEDLWVGVEPQDAEGDNLALAVAGALGAQGAADASAVELSVVADAVWRRAPTEVCLVFDDVHRLPGGSAGARWLSGLIDVLPVNGHVVLAGRAEPAIPLARLGAQGAIRRLGQDELRFSPAELKAFAARRGIAPEHFADTGGWPAVAELTASVDVRGLTGVYLWEEVLDPLGAERRRVLATVCDLGRADDQLASAALGSPTDLAAVLGGVPLVAEDADGRYIPHSLWHSAPGIELPPDERAAIRRRAAAHLRDRGLFDEAFALVEGAELWDEAPAILRAACIASERLRPAQLERWLAACPEEVRSSSVGCLASALNTVFTAPGDAIEPLRTAATRLHEDGDLDAELTAIAVLGRMAWTRQNLGPLGRELAARITELEVTGHPRAQGLARLVEALVADFGGDDAGVLAALDRIEPHTLDPAWEALASWIGGLVRLDLGDAEAAQAILDRVEPSSDPAVRAILGGLRVRTLWAQGHIDRAVEEASAVLADVRAAATAGLSYYGLTNGSTIFSHVGDVRAAQQCLDEAGDGPPGVGGPSAPRTLLAAASLDLATGDEERATARIRQALGVTGGRLDRGVERRMWRHLLPLTYVLAPETRGEWDRAALRGYLVRARQLARAVVTVRSGSPQTALPDLDLGSLDQVRSALHVRLAAELAVGLTASGRPEGPALLDALGPAGREAVRSLATVGSGGASRSAVSRTTKPARSLLAAVPAPPQHAVELAVLGPMVLRREGSSEDDGQPPALRRMRLRALLAFLVSHRTTDRAAIMAALWPDLDEKAASNNLAVTLNYVLQALEPSRAPGEPAYLVRQDGQGVSLVTGPHLRIDTDRFDRHLADAARAEADGTPSVALEHTLGAIGLYRGDLFADVPEADWMVLEREHYRTRFVSAATRAGQLLLARGDIEEAEAVARRALVADPWAEDAYAVLVSAAVAHGDRSGAHRLLEHCVTALADLGVEPSETTRQLRRRLQDGAVAAIQG